MRGYRWPSGPASQTSTCLRESVSALREALVGLFKSPTVDDAVLGQLERSHGQWRCKVAPDGKQKVPLALFGSNREPDPSALEAARQIAPSFNAFRPFIQQALFDHYTPYGEAAAAGEFVEGDMTPPTIAGPEQVWKHVSLQSVTIMKLGGSVTTEFVYAAAWDEDHMLGARFQAGQFVELCGSV